MSTPFAAVYFDCDSTLSAIEGVDELLQFAAPALRAEIRTLTEQAMNGERPLADVYATRLARLAPRREHLDRIGELYVARLVPDAALTVRALQALHKRVGIISGGLLVPVQRVAQHLGIEARNVHAVPLSFRADGSYADFDRGSPLWQNGGKIEIVRRLPATDRPIAFVGDGVTDLETRPHVDRFIGFGGVVRRAAVERDAEYFVTAPSLAAVLPFVLTAAERERLRADPTFAALLSAAER